ncbi:MAG TPA: chromosomal replication initiator protein DnaA [Candidatus Limnocylindrales bacterium]|nr:chromosomal replication initiator protein DnaA [Candidatus Limnocylindrales bacterium]
MDAKQVWRAALGELQVSLSPANFETWLRDTALVEVDDNRFRISVPNGFAKDWLETRYRSLISQTLARIVGYSVQVEFVVGPAAVLETDEADGAADGLRFEPVTTAIAADGGSTRNGAPARSPGVAVMHGSGATVGTAFGPRSSAAAPAASQTVRIEPTRVGGEGGTSYLNPRYTFANFIVGSANRLAHAASLSVAERPGHAYNPLFLYGGVGLGKTHLMHAIGNQVIAKFPRKRVVYATSEKFTNEFITSIQQGKIDDFRARYRRIDVLLIDDIQFIADKERTQEEFFHTFNAIHEDGKQIVLSSDRPPKAILTLEERLRSRFEWGLIADLTAPDLETRIAILRAKAEEGAVPITSDVIEFIARKVVSNIRELEGALNRIVAYASMGAMPISIELAQAVLSNVLYNPKKRQITPERIAKAVSDYYGVGLDALRGQKRDKAIVVPRQIAMFLMREETDVSLLRIGAELGGRDHSTVLHACDKIGREAAGNDELRREIAAVRELIYAD